MLLKSKSILDLNPFFLVEHVNILDLVFFILFCFLPKTKEIFRAGVKFFQHKKQDIKIGNDI